MAAYELSRNLVAELERRFRDEALTSEARAATNILDGVRPIPGAFVLGADADKIDEMVRQSPKGAYDIAFFEEFARAAGWTRAPLSREPRTAAVELSSGLSAVSTETATSSSGRRA